MPPAIIAIAAGGAAAFFGASLVLAGAIGIGAAAAVKYIGDALIPDFDMGAVNPAADQEITTSANQPRKIIYGEAVVGGQFIGYANPKIGDKKYHIMAIHLAGHPCESVEIYEIAGLSGAELASVVTAQYHLGTQTTANSLAFTYIDGWTAQHIGFGLTNAYLKIEENAEKFPNGVNEIKFKVKGKKLYDPRLDTTAGGSGSHRLNDANTWQYSTNPILCAYDWVMNHGYRPIPTRRIPWDFVALTANHCDELATYTDSNGDPQTEKRFTCNGVLNNSLRPGDGLKYLLSTMGANVYRPSGRLYIKPAMYAGPATISLTPADFIDQPTYQPHRPERERCNLVRGEYVAPELKYQQTDCPVVENQTLQGPTKDGAILEANLQLLMTNSSTTAQRLCNLYLQRNRAGFIGEVALRGVRLDVVPGSVVQFDDPATGISREFIVQNYRFDIAGQQTLVTLEEESTDIYPDDFTAVEITLPANSSLPDTTNVEPVTDVLFTATPADIYRQGFLSWEHPVANSVSRYVIDLYNFPSSTLIKTLHSQEQQVDIEGLLIGDYYANIAAYNRFGKRSPTLIPYEFSIDIITTPAVGTIVDTPPGGIVITPLAPPNINAIYEGLWTIDDQINPNTDDISLFSVIPSGKSLALYGIADAVTYYIWYRLKTPTGNGLWILRSIVGVGIRVSNFEPGLAELIDTIPELIDAIPEIRIDIDAIDVEFVDFRAKTQSALVQELFTREQTDLSLLTSMTNAAAAREDLRLRQKNSAVLIDAAVYVDPETGLIVNRAFKYTDTIFTSAALLIDGANASITAAVNRIELNENAVNELSAELLLVPGQISATATAIVSSSLAALVPAHAFNFFDTTQGWVSVNGTITAGVNQVTTTWADIENDELDYVADDNKSLRIAIERTAGTGWAGTVVIERDDTTMHTFTGIIDAPTETGQSILLVNFEGSTAYTGTINRVRLMLGESVTDEFIIKSITIGKADAQTQDLANLTARVTEAEFDINANEGAIAAKVSTAFYEANTVTFNNVGLTLDSLESYISLVATQQSINENDVITKANEAGVFIDGHEGTFTAYAQAVSDELEGQGLLINDAQLAVNAVDGKITQQVSGLKTLQIESYDDQLALLDEITKSGVKSFKQLDKNLSFAVAIDQLNIDVGPDGALAQNILNLEAITVNAGKATTAIAGRLTQAETDIDGNANALDQLNLDVASSNQATQASIDRLDEVTATQEKAGASLTQQVSVVHSNAFIDKSSLLAEIAKNGIEQFKATDINLSTALAINQLTIDVGEQGALAQNIATLEALSVYQNFLVTSAVRKLDRVRTDTQGNTSAISAMNITVKSTKSGLSATVEKLDGVEIKTDETAEAFGLVKAAVENENTGLSASYDLAQSAKVTADSATSTLTEQVSGLKTLQAITQDEQAALLAAIVRSGAEAINGTQRDLNFANAINQLKINVSEDGALAQNISTLNAISVLQNYLVTSTITKLDRVRTDMQGNASALSQLRAAVNNPITGVSATLKLTADINESLDTFRATATLAVDANGNVALIQLDATPEDTLIKVKTNKFQFLDDDDNEFIVFDSVARKSRFNGILQAEQIIGDTAAGDSTELSAKTFLTSVTTKETIFECEIGAVPYLRTVVIPCPWFASFTSNTFGRVRIGLYKNGATLPAATQMAGGNYKYSSNAFAIQLSANESATLRLKANWEEGVTVALNQQSLTVSIFRQSDQITFINEPL